MRTIGSTTAEMVTENHMSVVPKNLRYLDVIYPFRKPNRAKE